MAQKFVINNGVLLLGNVEFHEDLVKFCDKNKTIGGGRWFHHNDTNIIYFWGESFEFGKVTEEEFNSSIKQSSVLKATLVFSTDNDFKLKL